MYWPALRLVCERYLMISDLRHTSLDDVEEFLLVLDAWQDAGFRALGGK